MTKKFDEQTYYELLEIPFNATPFEIRQAYKEALSIYNEDSLSTYSFFSDEERTRILQRVEEAVFTLLDASKRSDYDKALVSEGRIDAAILDREREKKPIPLFQRNRSRHKDVFLNKIAKKTQERNVKELSDELLSKTIISGDDIKKLREAIGIEIEVIFEITRINVATLESIEEDHYEKLPPEIYLKNFLRAYADVLHVDAEKFADGYLKNIARVHEGSD